MSSLSSSFRPQKRRRYTVDGDDDDGENNKNLEELFDMEGDRAADEDDAENRKTQEIRIADDGEDGETQKTDAIAKNRDNGKVDNVKQSPKDILHIADQRFARLCMQNLCAIKLNYKEAGKIAHVKIPFEAKEYLASVRKDKSFDIGDDAQVANVLTIFAGLLIKSGTMDSSFAPLPVDEIKKLTSNMKVEYGTDVMSNKTKGFPFNASTRSFPYGIIVQCMINTQNRLSNGTYDTNIAIVKDSLIMENINVILQAGIDEIINHKRQWKKLLNDKAREKNLPSTTDYRSIVTACAGELKESLVNVANHPAFDTFMRQDDDIVPSHLFLQPTSGFNNNNKFQCIDFVEDESGQVHGVEKGVDELKDEEDFRFYGICNNFKFIVTDKKTCYMKTYVRWGIAIRRNEDD